jgi:hypothetical protein
MKQLTLHLTQNITSEPTVQLTFGQLYLALLVVGMIYLFAYKYSKRYSR